LRFIAGHILVLRFMSLFVSLSKPPFYDGFIVITKKDRYWKTIF